MRKIETLRLRPGKIKMILNLSFTRIYALGLRHYFLTFRHLERFADLFIFPIVGLLLWGFLANYVQVQSQTLASFFWVE